MGAGTTAGDLASGVSLAGNLGGEPSSATAALASRLQWDQYQRLAALHQSGSYTVNHKVAGNPSNPLSELGHGRTVSLKNWMLIAGLFLKA